ncbi:hypothetical protein GGU11DRAFT_807886 [Lentinula aff. detonsa]|nr:hypothetical protein GGU11DRAFT_807886 [Lentinula aff. detonsa]
MSKATRRSGRKAKLQEAPNAPSGQTSRKPKSERAEAPQEGHSSFVSPNLAESAPDNNNLPRVQQKEKAKPLHATPEQTALQRPNTPERQHKQVTKDLESTPHSHGSSSFTSALPPGRKYHVDEANKYLHADLLHTRILPVKEFTMHTLNLNVDKDTYVMSREVEEKFDTYLRVVEAARNELYPALLALLNVIPSNHTTFYKQDHIQVGGSLVGQIPDIGVILKELAGDGDVYQALRDQKKKILWGHLLMVVEDKVRKGKAITPEFGKDGTQKWSKEDEDLEGFEEEEMPQGSKEEEIPEGSEQHEGSKEEEDFKGSDVSTSRSDAAYNLLPRRTGGQNQNEPTGEAALETTHRPNTFQYQTPMSVSSSQSSTSYLYEKMRRYNRLPQLPKRLSAQGVRMQVAGYARDIVSYGLPRSHVFLFVVDSHLARVIFYDRSVAVTFALRFLY